MLLSIGGKDELPIAVIGYSLLPFLIEGGMSTMLFLPDLISTLVITQPPLGSVTQVISTFEWILTLTLIFGADAFFLVVIVFGCFVLLPLVSNTS